MHAPKSYSVRKFPLKLLIDHQYHLELTPREEQLYLVKQQDNQLFRLIRSVTGNSGEFQPCLVFVNCKGGKSYESELLTLIRVGLWLGGRHYVISERSASMTRSGILSFIDETIGEEVNRRITMEIHMERTVLSKYYAYRGLLLSSCHCLENWYPKIVIVPDYERIIPAQKIRFAVDQKIRFTDKSGVERDWVQKEIAQDTVDVRINVFDGSGIHHPAITARVRELTGSRTAPTTILWRAPYIKGVTHEMDYETFYRERGVDRITDVWGQEHDFSQPMILMTESMYKGKKYFEQHKDYTDWERYWECFRKYGHCIGAAKWNYSAEEEPLYTRANYQILQDLNLSYQDFASLARYSIGWAERIVSGDPLTACCFLGLFADTPEESLNDYTRAVLKNSEMLKEDGVRSYLISLLRKYRDDFKCGKLFLKSAFKFLTADPILLMEHIGGLEPTGALQADEFYSFDIHGPYLGKRLIERNPHICRSEHVILNAVTNELLDRYCSHLSNTCIINGKSITPQRLNGADFDGDLVLVVDEPVMLKGVDPDIPIVMDREDKATAMEEPDTPEGRALMIMRTMNNIIGETSNCATVYHNKMPRTPEQKAVYESYIDLLSIINGKAIDYAKTGMLYQIPRNIAKYGHTLPYFMKYAGPYYSSLKEFSRSQSNLNRLCLELEKWDKTLRFAKPCAQFDYRIMLDPDITVPAGTFEAVEQIYLDFCREMGELGREQSMIRNYDKYKDELDGRITRKDAQAFLINWQFYYDKYRNACKEVCPDAKLLANIAVLLCYEKYPKKNKKFIWRVAADGLLKNIRARDGLFPLLDEQGQIDPKGPSPIPVCEENDADRETYEYLGKRYRLSPYLEASQNQTDNSNHLTINQAEEVIYDR